MMSVGQFSSFGSFAFGGVFIVMGLFALMILPLVIIVVANRAEPDSRGLRPFAVYLFGMSFVTLQLAYGGLSMIVTALLSYITPHRAPITNSLAREVVIGGLFVVIAGAVLRFHLKQGLSVARGDGRVDGPNARVMHSYLGVVSFSYLISAMITFGVALYLVFELAGPGVFGGGGSKAATVNVLLDFAYLFLSSVAIVGLCWRHAPAGAFRTPKTAGPPATVPPPSTAPSV
jgi:hypothetical protein